LHNHRVHLASREQAYRCIWYGPDQDGNVGTYLGKDVVAEATRALSLALWKVGPQVLTMRQVAAFVGRELRRRVVRGGKDKIPPYKPNFEECLDHFLIHAGGGGGEGVMLGTRVGVGLIRVFLVSGRTHIGHLRQWGGFCERWWSGRVGVVVRVFWFLYGSY
jgi:hypothetical protein